MKINLSIRKRLFLSHFVVVILVSGSIGSFFYWNASRSLMESLQSRLKSSVAMISRTLDAASLVSIETPEDTARKEYATVLENLREFRMSNPDVAFLYIMRRVGEDIHFVVDSDRTDQQAKPGDVYENPPETLEAGFLGPSVDEELIEDEWGVFLSGYAPLPSGNGQYLLGMDMRADEVKRKFQGLRTSGIISLTASLVLAYLFSMLLSNHFTMPIEMLVGRCSAIAEGRLDEHVYLRTRDELDSLIGAFNSMSTRLGQTREQYLSTQNELERAKDILEVRVQERTRELTDLNEQLNREITQRRLAEETLRVMASSDSLTGLLNRRAMTERLEQETARAFRHDSPYSLLMLDLDHFKKVNDNYGHAVGDEVLKETARRIKEQLRKEDVVSRWGGEEFLMLLPDTEEQGAYNLAEKLRLRICEEKFTTEKGELAVAASLGVATFNKSLTLHEMVENADMAMYQAKVRGRNQVAVIGPVA